MPYPTEPLTPEEEDELSLALRGGLKGRFARGFSVLHGGIGTLDRYLAQNAKPGVHAQAREILTQMSKRLAALERLADNTADLALGSAMHAAAEPEWLELGAFLREFCAIANEELAARRSPARVTLEPGAPLYLYAPVWMLQALFANLFSNSVAARADTAITLHCAADGTLFYRDTGPGLPPEQSAPLESGAAAPLLRIGCTGLALVAAYAASLGWALHLPKAEAGFSLELCVGAQPVPPALALHSTGAQDAARTRQMQAVLRRELDAALAPPL